MKNESGIHNFKTHFPECSNRFKHKTVQLCYSVLLWYPSNLSTGWDGKRLGPRQPRQPLCGEISREVSSLTDGPLIDLHCLFLLKAAWPKYHLSIYNSYNPNKQTSHLNSSWMGFCHKVSSLSKCWVFLLWYNLLRTNLRTTVIYCHLMSHRWATHV